MRIRILENGNKVIHGDITLVDTQIKIAATQCNAPCYSSELSSFSVNCCPGTSFSSSPSRASGSNLTCFPLVVLESFPLRGPCLPGPRFLFFERGVGESSLLRTSFPSSPMFGEAALFLGVAPGPIPLIPCAFRRRE